MPIYHIDITRWEPQTGSATIEASTLAEAKIMAAEDARALEPQFFSRFEPDTTQTPRVRFEYAKKA